MSAPTLHPAHTADAVERARDAAERESWAEAYALLHAHDLHPSRALTADDLSVLADAAWWSGHIDESVTARLRAHAAFLAAGDHRGAGLAAWWLHFEYRSLGRPAAAAGWLHRARHHLEDEPPCPEQCFLAWTDAEEAEQHGDRAAALAAARRMARLALRSASPDLVALSRQAESAVLLANGRRTEALALLDDAMCAVTAGELSGVFTGWLYCLALTQCMEAADFGRAVEWTNAAMEWCAPPWTGRPAEAVPGTMPGATSETGPEGGPATLTTPAARTVASGENPFRGVCRAHRVEVLDLLGTWALAEEEARQACREVPVDCLESAAAAFYAAGDVQRRQGRLDEAAVSYAHAHELGRIPQPGLALLRLAQGRADAAVAGVDLALACQSDPRHDLLGRARLLAARTEVALAVRDVPGASKAARELDALAGDVPLLRATADTALGAVALAEARSGPALRLLRQALAGWLELRVPYEAAQVRMLLAAADRTVGDEEAARLELAAARTVFERLGAVPDARRAAALLSGGKRRRLPGGLTAREAEVLRLVAGGGTNKDIAQALVISEHTVSRHLNNIFAKLGVSSRAAATAYAYAHDIV
ncbi:response regulator receiver protein [Streptomyces venezuelae]|uniref:LuxR family transcriptional regulator n=1 Tax=Streptomyces gardneri TaxID=66892 RepID=UPI0006BD138C|nr:LuxR family transcriptional regulator [Streptomyces gardneri]ALO08345.1 response regulator receiver protein [Streptomyces venezuelae]QPK45567.1 LuxR family transcriptional regulator [Streptomyces gardneri]WRK36909.1 LuxR C-terminal-related transcriptional regulator [Streptomyces venezuelae]CUM41300.1 regulatory protein, LuxR:Peptidase M, neutral zinc metallopeptidases, zinc-binding site:Peptidase M, neutral zinc metallopeptidases, zinc-binding site [Streptomyces venezuelae]